jgi:hypothetical protein
MSLDALTLGAGNTLFISERRRLLERSNVCKMVNTFAKAAGLSELNVHPHMLNAFLRVRSGEPRRRYALHSRVSRAPEHLAHCAIPGAVTNPLCKSVLRALEL